jgi:hypothetical protein
MGDITEFLGAYQEGVRAEVEAGTWPRQILDTFTLESPLRSHADREVFLVTDKRTGAKAVLRVSAAKPDGEPDDEFALLKSLDHPGIPKVFGSITQNGYTYTAREYFFGQSLDKVVSARTMSAQEILNVTRQLCDILDYLHTRSPSIIHRDIKPHNLILMPDGRVGLTDFDIARTYKPEQDFDTRHAGTVPYAPPEQHGFSQSNPQTDIYALGIALIHLATGEPNPDGFKERIADKRLLSLIERCIAFDPAQRFQNVGQIALHLKRLKTRPLRMAAAVAGALLGVALLGVGAFFLVKNLPIEPGGNGSVVVVDEGEPDYPDGADPLTYENPFVNNTEFTDRLYDMVNDGNLASNVHAGGFAVDGSTGNFFYLVDNEVLYVLSHQGEVGAKLLEDTYLKSLNQYNDGLFFSCSEGIVRLDPRSWRYEVVGDSPGLNIIFDNGRLYYTTAASGHPLMSARIDGNGVSKIDGISLDPLASYPNIVDGVLYYVDVNDSNRIYRFDLQTGENQLFYEGNCRNLSACNGNLYFIDEGLGGAIMRMNFNSRRVTRIADGYFCSLNASSRGLFAIESEERAKDGILVVMDGNGENRRVLTDARVTSFCLSTEWIVYRIPENTYDYTTWLMKLDGSNNHVFDPGEAAAQDPAARPRTT